MIPAEPSASSVPGARLSATILLLRSGEAGLEVFMVVRHRAIDFASGALVFPGGALEPDDRDIAEAETSARDGRAHDVEAVRVAAIREAFEESGILLARRRGEADMLGTAAMAAIRERHRAELLEGRLSFAAMIAAEDLRLATDMLVPFAHWITPVASPKRFDTHFFLADLPDGHVGSHDGLETVDSLWISPSQAISDAQAGRFSLVPATRLNLEKLSRSGSPEDALAAAGASPIVTVLPELVGELKAGHGRIRIPAESGYGGTEFDF